MITIRKICAHSVYLMMSPSCAVSQSTARAVGNMMTKKDSRLFSLRILY
jgi:hypothetical protein